MKQNAYQLNLILLKTWMEINFLTQLSTHVLNDVKNWALHIIHVNLHRNFKNRW